MEQIFEQKYESVPEQNIILRKATPIDAEAIAEGIVSAGGRFLPWLFGKDYKGIICDCTNAQNCTFSWTNAVICEVDGRVAGVVICYPSEKEQEMDKEMSVILRKNFNFFEMFGFISKAKKAIKHFTKPKTSYYILAIAVFEDFRGQGVSAKLLSYVERQARLGGYTSLALEVEGYNYSAIRAYQKYGFVKIKEVPLEKFSKSLKINKHASMWLMRKDLR